MLSAEKLRVTSVDLTCLVLLAVQIYVAGINGGVAAHVCRGTPLFSANIAGLQFSSSIYIPQLIRPSCAVPRASEKQPRHLPPRAF